VSAGCPKQKHGRPDHRGQTQSVASAPSGEADKGETETGKAELNLERAVGRADEACRHSTEEDVVDEFTR
jgi:hypothetical protein